MKWFLSVLLLVVSTYAMAQSDGSSAKPDRDQTRHLQMGTPQSQVNERSLASQASRVLSWEQDVRNRIHIMVSHIPEIPGEIDRVIRVMRAESVDLGYSETSVIFLIMLLAAIAAERLVRRNLLHHWGGFQNYLLPLIFTAFAGALYFALNLPRSLRIVAGCYLLAFILYRLVAAVIQHSPKKRQEHGRIKLIIGTLIFAYSSAMVGTALDVNGDVLQSISFLSSGVVLVLGIELTWGVSSQRSPVRIARSLYLIVVWIIWALAWKTLFWISVYLVTFPPLLRTVSHAVRDHLTKAVSVPTSNTRDILLIRGSRAIVIGIGLMWIAYVWQTDTHFVGHDLPHADDLIFSMFRIIMVVLTADLVWHLAKAAVDRMIHTRTLVQGYAESTSEDTHATRLHTLLPILKNLLAVAVVVIAGLAILGQLGVDIGPLIAGAGIFGVAIGFGSQALVRDVISGIFYLFDDAFRVGEYIQAKNYKGTVEGFSLRSVRLRHHRGPIFTVPFGELGAVENMSRDWSKVKLLITVPYDADLEKVRKIGKAIGQRLAENTEFAGLFIEPLKMKGVEEFAEYGIVVSFAMITVPTSQQSFIRRTAYAMLRQSFQENGISFARPTVDVSRPEAGDIAAAALQHRQSTSARQEQDDSNDTEDSLAS
ncbi:mechanosensitive ion channel family protein [Agrobacterium radiobacter]|uniref:mechanosensitive ion channel family protein n=1 Tax=Agrobacterium radiobacter TaxID=362 RepID=UPI000760F861|nr:MULTISPECIES: mechanosensitive ion channel family protein [Agrobacterium tumefaciens complex]KAB0456382.1 mechanosensitive ion channel family protein [Agrobacterium tumefaciens]KWT79423.1 hypothetical protein ASH09_21250 [Agrobacterium radiobacter]NIB12650.1 mechanosensitive ion channel family protein [Agrobacterium radiobacter]OOO36389.1 hypothetical protein BS628_12060 [Agrobacterium radiobacter]